MVSTPEFTQLDKGKSMIRYFPPNGTAGLATVSVKVPNRLPWPPANSIAIDSFLDIADIYSTSLVINPVVYPGMVIPFSVIVIAPGFGLVEKATW